MSTTSIVATPHEFSITENPSSALNQATVVPGAGMSAIHSSSTALVGHIIDKKQSGTSTNAVSISATVFPKVSLAETIPSLMIGSGPKIELISATTCTVIVSPGYKHPFVPLKILSITAPL